MIQIKQFRLSYKMKHKGVNLMINAGIGILKLTAIPTGSMTTYRLPTNSACAPCAEVHSRPEGTYDGEGKQM